MSTVKWSAEAYQPKHEDRVAEIEASLFCKPLSGEFLRKAHSVPLCGGLVIVHRKKVQAYVLYENQISYKKGDKNTIATHIKRVVSADGYAGKGMEDCLMERLIRRSVSWKTPLVIDLPDFDLSGQLFLKGKDFLCVKTIQTDDETLYRMVYNHKRLPENLFISRKKLIEQALQPNPEKMK